MKQTKGWVFALFILLLLGTASANCNRTQADELMNPFMRQLIFERVWATVKDNYVYPDFHGLNWQDSKKVFSQEILTAPTNAAFYKTVDAMIYALGDDHSVYFAPWESCLEASVQEDSSNESPIIELKRLEQDPNTVLVTLKHFDTLSLDEDFSLLLRQAFKEGSFDTLILDLRHNFGGYLDTALNILGQFYYGKVGYEIDQNGVYPLTAAPGKYYRRLEDTRLIVLVDHESHSAAEIVAGVLQLERDATVIGSPSAGNTEIVLPYDFFDGSRLWLAVSSFNLRDGTNLEGQGVIPDILVEDESLVFDRVLEFLADQDKLVSR